ncbi:hypothetical protein ES705_47336 [subsurface metagenome]
MLDRCENPRREQYKYYGAKGIKVCASWHFFRSFYEDMGPRQSAKYQIDRIDNNGDYEPQNCRWATPTQNNRNKPNVMLSMEKARDICKKYRVEGLGLTSLGKKYGVSKHMIYLIVNNKKWVEER